MLAKIHSNTAGSRSRGGRFTLNRVASGRSKDRSGTTVVMLVILLPVMLAVAAYCINVVYMEMARTELQISTDLATRAAGRVLAVTGDKGEAIDAAERLLEANPYLNRTLSIGDADIIFGKSTRTEENRRYEFTPDKKVNSVSLRAFGADDVPMLFPTMGVPIEFRPIKQAGATQVELDIA
ncbi:TadE/TadG family type IV pilus assembly protein, partial [Rhodopirellula bahusiensis]|uniref:TadE/TadG family type IV pilus assembly protein n=1 Tax=Rhodopirellula bahusiensis TaxID=2014065 RepID=UPI0032635F0A